MANYLHWQLNASDGSSVVVTLDRAANVLLLDGSNYAAYRSGRRFSYSGGLARRSPVRLAVPHAGTWHVVVELGGGSGHVRASVVVAGG